jgi:hypothetical protein
MRCKKKVITFAFNERKRSLHSGMKFGIFLTSKMTVKWEERYEITTCVSETPFISLCEQQSASTSSSLSRIV